LNVEHVQHKQNYKMTSVLTTGFSRCSCHHGKLHKKTWKHSLNPKIALLWSAEKPWCSCHQRHNGTIYIRQWLLLRYYYALTHGTKHVKKYNIPLHTNIFSNA